MQRYYRFIRISYQAITSQCINCCRKGVYFLEELINEVEKDQPADEPTILFDDPSIHTDDPNDKVHMDHQTQERLFTYSFDERLATNIELACKGYNVSYKINLTF